MKRCGEMNTPVGVKYLQILEEQEKNEEWWIVALGGKGQRWP